MSALGGEDGLVIVNAEIRNVDLTVVFEERRLVIKKDRVYCVSNREDLFAETAAHFSFIGCVVFRRPCWLARERQPYYGSLFIHVGVIFQSPPLTTVKVIAKPLIIVDARNLVNAP